MSTAGVTPLSKWARKNVRIRNEYVTGFIGEFFGNIILCMFAFGAGASGTFHQNYVVSVFGGVFGLMVAVTVFGGLSGAHINPAVSLGLAMVGEMSWFKLPVYWFAQFLGSYLGAGLGYSLYDYQLKTKLDFDKCKEAVDVKECETKFYNDISGFFSAPPGSNPVGTVFADQIVTTGVLFLAIMSAIDRRNMKVPTHFFGIFFALVVAGVAFAFGINAGGSMNPARDLGPRMFAVSLGANSTMVFKNSFGEHYWLGTLFGPLIGATVGGLIYVFCVGSHLKDTDEEDENKAKKGQGQNENGDWRSTVYIPKVPASQNGGGNYATTGAPYSNGGSNYAAPGVPYSNNAGMPIQNGPPPASPYGPQNPSYSRDDRQRQY